MVSFKNKKIGLVLSGGGAKGAYQIGMLRALEEAGLKKEQLVMAGTSIGAQCAFICNWRSGCNQKVYDEIIGFYGAI